MLQVPVLYNLGRVPSNHGSFWHFVRHNSSHANDSSLVNYNPW